MPIGEYYQDYGPVKRRRGDDASSPHITRPPKPRRRPPRQRATTSVWRLVARVAMLLFLLLAALPYGVSLFYYGRPLPGTSIQGRPVGNLDQQAIKKAVDRRYAPFLKQPITLTYEDQTWNPILSDLGVRFDSQEIAAMALAPGRRGDPITRLYELWLLWREGYDMAPHLVVDWHHLQRYLTHMGTAIEQPPRDASLTVAMGKVIGAPAKVGVQVLVDETAADIALSLRKLAPQQVIVRTRILTPTIGNEPLRVAQVAAQRFITPTLVLTRSAETWQWDKEKIANLLSIEPSGQRIVVGIHPERLTAEVARLAELVDSGSVEPRLRFEHKKLQVIQEGKIGWKLRQPEAVRAISETLYQRQYMATTPTHIGTGTQTNTLALPVNVLHPQVTPEKLADLGINELVGEGKSSFADSAPYRITNIKAGAARLDGVLIAPDEEFSFNTQLGDVNAENGFVEGYAVIGNRTQLEWGGGVCQDSTTVFRAAFWAGLPITERHAHPFYIRWYDRFAFGENGDGAGMDATIYTGMSDLKFVNDTGHWLLMQTIVDEANQVLTVQLYGTKPNREVVLDGPHVSNEMEAPSTPVYISDPSKPDGTLYQSDVARNGRDIVVYRSVRQGGVEVARDTFFTRFNAWPNVFVRGTGSGN